MALLFDYRSEPELNNANFSCEILQLTRDVLGFSHASLAEDLRLSFTLLKPELNLKKALLHSDTIDNLLLLNTLGAAKVHQIITTLVRLGDDTLLKPPPPQTTLLRNIKTLIKHWSDFGQWIVLHSRQENP